MKPAAGSANRAPDRLAMPEKLAYGGGGILAFSGNPVLMVLLFPLYNIYLGVDPIWIGLVIALSRIWDAVTDPIMGVLSDNTRGRFGRRRPYLVLGSVACAVTLPSVWLVGHDWTEMQKVMFMVVTALLFLTSFTIYSVPYWALGSEMTPDYNERTRVVAVRTMIGLIAMHLITAWVYRLTQIEAFGNPMRGAVWISLLLGLVFIATGCIAAKWTRERYNKVAAMQKKVGLWQAIRDVLTNKQALIVLSAFVVASKGAQVVQHFGIYINTYHIFDGNTVIAATYVGIGGTIGAAASFLAIQPICWISTRIGKEKTLIYSMLLGIFGSASTFYFFNPQYPWLQFISVTCLSVSASGINLIVSSLKADIVDHDEYQTGLRREGAYGSAFGWANKCTGSLAALFSGFLLAVTGFDQSMGADQPESALLSMRFYFAVIPVGFLAISIVVMRYYSLSAEVLANMRAELEQRRGKVQ